MHGTMNIKCSVLVKECTNPGSLDARGPQVLYVATNVFGVVFFFSHTELRISSHTPSRQH